MRKSRAQDDGDEKAPLCGEVSSLLRAWTNGDQGALEKLTPIVYDELHHLACYYMSGERIGHSLQTTALVNEAYLRLTDYKRMRWENRAHFFAVSAQSCGGFWWIMPDATISSVALEFSTFLWRTPQSWASAMGTWSLWTTPCKHWPASIPASRKSWSFASSGDST